MEFGIFDQIDCSGRPLNIQYEQRMELAELYDRSGFYCLHQSEHHSTPLSMAPSQNIFLASLAQRTKRLRLCPLVYVLPIHHPMRLAEEICMLDHLSNGRFEFGIGRGASPFELEALGVPAESAAEAYAESYAILQKYFSSKSVTHEGKYWTIRDAPVTMTPLQAPIPPMWYVAASPESIVWPAKQGFNVICGGPADKVRLISDRYRAEAGPGNEDALVGIWRFVVVAETDAEALQTAEQAWPRFHDSFYLLWRVHNSEPQRLKLPGSFADVVASGFGVAGSPQTVAKVLTRQARAGNLNYLMSHFMFGDMPHGQALKSVELFASEVMPAIKKEASGGWL